MWEGGERTLIPRNDDTGVRLEESINIFERAVCGFGVEEVGDRDERETDNCPYNPEFPPKVIDSRGCYLDDHVVLPSRCEQGSIKP